MFQGWIGVGHACMGGVGQGRVGHTGSGLGQGQVDGLCHAGVGWGGSFSGWVCQDGVGWGHAGVGWVKVSGVVVVMQGWVGHTGVQGSGSYRVQGSGAGFPQHQENLENDRSFSSHGNITELYNFERYHGKIRRNFENENFSYY